MFLKTLFYHLKSLFRKPKSEQYYEYQLLTGEVLTIKKGEMFDVIVDKPTGCIKLSPAEIAEIREMVMPKTDKTS